MSAAELELVLDDDMEPEETVVELEGELDLNTAPQVEQDLMGELVPGRHLVVDLERLEFCDAAGLRVFLRVRRHAIAQGSRVRFVHANRAVRRVMEVSELGWLIGEPTSKPPVTPRQARWYST